MMREEEFLESVERMVSGLPKDKMDEILCPMIRNGIITYEIYEQILYNMTRKKVLSEHPFKIAQHKDGRYRTYVITPDGTKRQLVRTTLKKLQDDIVKNYEAVHKETVEEESPTFQDCYFKWRELHDLKISPNTISKYETDAKRYFEGEEFVNVEIRKITGDMVERFVFKKVKELSLCREATKSLLGYIKGTFKSAVRNRIIKEDITSDITAGLFFRQCTETNKPEDVLLVPDDDWSKLYYKLQDDFVKHPTYMPPYAIMLVAYTGMRVGELAVLKWTDIKSDPVSGLSFFAIHRSEIYIVAEKRYEVVDHTKNHKNRVYPITPQIKELLDKIREVYADNGIETEWIFAAEDGSNIHKRNICDCLKNRCKQIGISTRGMHAFRRQLNSDMRCDGVSPVITSSLIGNTLKVNAEHYTFDVYGLDEKAKIVEKTNLKRKSIAKTAV